MEALNRKEGLYGRSNPLVPGLLPDREVYGELLDFVAPANHYGGREEASQELWRSTQELCDGFDDPGRFATLYGYEWGAPTPIFPNRGAPASVPSVWAG